MKRDARSRVTIVANLVLAAGLMICLLALAYFFYHYGWVGDRQFTSAIGPFVYYGLPVVVATSLSGTFLLRPSVRENLALLLLSTAVSLIFAEAVLEAIKPERTTLWTPSTREQIDELVELASEFGVEYDTRTQLQVVRDLRLQGLDAVPAVYPFGQFERQADGTVMSRLTINNEEVVALGGISEKLTVFCNEAGEWITYESDEHGFHNPRGLWGLQTLDIAVVGDSYTQGACVPSDRNFVAVIRARYPATLNLGNSNKGSLMSLADLKEYAAGLKPGVVLWFFYEQNDLGDLSRERDSPLLMRYLERNFAQGLVHLQADLDSALEQYWVGTLERVQTHWPEREQPIIPAVLRFSNLRQRIGLMRHRIDPRVELEQTIDLLAEILSEAKATVDSWGGRLYVVYLPERERYVEPRTASVDEIRRERILGLTRSLGVEFIDIHSAFQSSGDPLDLFPFRRRGHYNEEGHRLVGETVLRVISAP